MTEQQLKEMKLHDTVSVQTTSSGMWYITRVVGGWIYKTVIGNTPNCVFVPESNKIHPALG